MVVGTFDGRVGSGDLGVARDLLVGDDLNVRDSAFVGDNLRVRGRLSVRDKITTDSIITSEIELREPEPGSRAPVMRAGGNIVVGDDSFQAEEVPRSARTNSVVVQNFVVADRMLVGDGGTFRMRSGDINVGRLLRVRTIRASSTIQSLTRIVAGETCSCGSQTITR
ncbi:unnamed protein product [Vitrella brassicaformis CCMP3155]|uniref:Uncharacterized protein n=1 Tax=Vitrella brassicaformis (strain CCMP3155) TaxID=1169540 RepID=A0A0G4EG25_VITBC|nr:unnamed protein product [Vitrella brassicaformis CCMP3155]|eukprot:CEL94433.1 unnamed protein product [Vitrella brassicaformis CCMP3155]